VNGNLYMPAAPSQITEIIDETPTIKTFRVEHTQPLSFQAGQFVEVLIPGLGEAPFTPSSSPAVSATMDLTIMRVGRVTEKLHALEPGAEIGIRGPLGEPYPLDKFVDRDIVIAGGGVGLAPLRAFLFALFQDIERYGKIIVRYGARSPADIVYRDALKDAWGHAHDVDVLVTVDKGDENWPGPVGVVTTILDPEDLPCTPADSVAVVCGPPVMMRFVTLKLLNVGFKPEDIYLSMEKNMSCGIGKCGHCRVGTFYACKDGPVFPYSQLQEIPKTFD
jgi:NAD(P)H-flavin reductase